MSAARRVPPAIFGRSTSVTLLVVIMLSFGATQSKATTHSLAYVSDTDTNVVVLIDSVTRQPAGQVTVGAGPQSLAVSPDSSRVLVPNSLNNTASIIDTSTQKVIATVPVGKFPVSATFSPDSKLGYIVNQAEGSLSVINLATNAVSATVAVGHSPRNLAFTLDGTLAYVTVFGDNKVLVLRASDHAIVTSISVPSPVGVTLSRDGSKVFVTSSPPNSNGKVAVISRTQNTVTATISVGMGPCCGAVTIDGLLLYVVNSGSKSVSVINIAGNKVIATIPLGRQAEGLALSPDGASVWVCNDESGTLSVISRATNQVVGSVGPVPEPHWVAIAPTPVTTSAKITQPLSPTELNIFNFGSHTFKVQYPAGTSFFGVKMSVTAQQISPAAFKQRVVGTPFGFAVCITYGGTGENCIIYQVSCSNLSNQSVSCPTTGSDNIAVLTSYDTQQVILNPGFLHAPTNTNQWTNIFTDFFLQRIDPTTKGETVGFSDFVAVDLGPAASVGVGTFGGFLPPLRHSRRHAFNFGGVVPIRFQVISPTGQFITNASVFISVTNGSVAEPVRPVDHKGFGNEFVYNPHRNDYEYFLSLHGYPPGSYVLTVYSNSFPAQQVFFTVH